MSSESFRLTHSTLDGVPDILKSCKGPWLPSLSRFSLSSDGHILGMSLCLWEPWRKHVHLLSPLSHTSFLPREPTGASLQGPVQMSCSFLRACRALSKACLPSRATCLPKNKPPDRIGSKEQKACSAFLETSQGCSGKTKGHLRVGH